MKLSILFIANAIFAAFGAFSLLVAPEQTFSAYGATLDKSGIFVAHILGATVLGMAVISYLFRNIKDKAALKPILLAFIITHAGSTIFALSAATTGLFNQMVWVDVIAHAAFAAGFGYHLTKK